jgi:Xaa-Pro aminopeptidase
MCRFLRFSCIAAILAISLAPLAHSLERQASSVYHARRVALAAKLHGGVAVLFAAEEPALDFMPYRQDEDFYYLTGWNEPGAALLIVADAGQVQTAGAQTADAQTPRTYKEILFLPTRDLRMEKYTGAKLDAVSPGVAEATGVDAVQPMTELPAVLNRLIDSDRRLLRNVWAQPESAQAKALMGFTAVTLGQDANASTRDATTLTQQLRVVKDAGEIALLRKAAAASIEAQRVMMRAAKRLRTGGVCAHRGLGDQLDYAALLGEHADARGRRHSAGGCGLRVLDVRLRHYADGAGERPLHGAAAGDLQHRAGGTAGGDRRFCGGQVEDQRPRPARSGFA